MHQTWKQRDANLRRVTWVNSTMKKVEEANSCLFRVAFFDGALKLLQDLSYESGLHHLAICFFIFLNAKQVNGNGLFFQEPSCITEKAVVVADMDESVNRAVILAKHTAKAARVVAINACLVGGADRAFEDDYVSLEGSVVTASGFGEELAVVTHSSSIFP
nr:hypothetical protein [Tanacetum cinerariifolium]